MPPNGNAGASSASYLSNAYGIPNQSPSQRSARAFIAISVSLSASARRDCRIQSDTGTGGAAVVVATERVVVAHGPAANAIRYVLSRCVSAKRCVTAAPAVSVPTRAPLASARQSTGVVSAKRTRAFRSGWSKQGKSRFASDGTSNVYRYTRPSAASRVRIMLAPACATGVRNASSTALRPARTRAAGTTTCIRFHAADASAHGAPLMRPSVTDSPRKSSTTSPGPRAVNDTMTRPVAVSPALTVSARSYATSDSWAARRRARSADTPGPVSAAVRGAVGVAARAPA